MKATADLQAPMVVLTVEVSQREVEVEGIEREVEVEEIERGAEVERVDREVAQEENLVRGHEAIQKVRRLIFSTNLLYMWSPTKKEKYIPV